jgi:phosphatidylserine decarboxylase
VKVLNRASGKVEIEKVYGGKVLELLYGDSWIAPWFVAMTAKIPFFSAFYGWLQKRPFSKKKIEPFIQEFHVDSSEFLKKVPEFQSFNDFFIRELKPSARPIAKTAAICPADGRYRFFPSVSEAEGFYVKGEKFNLSTLLEDSGLASRYSEGSLMIARLCPTDYHRFHFPVACTPSTPRFINGWLYSVNPIALKKDIHIFTKNKRAVTELKTEEYGTILFIEIGATNVGSIRHTAEANVPALKGSEKGYFEFGASALIVLFEPGQITFAPDLLQEKELEIKCLMGQELGIMRGITL